MGCKATARIACCTHELCSPVVSLCFSVAVSPSPAGVTVFLCSGKCCHGSV